MGYADGYYYGQGRIICDTSTFSVGDTIRVRSVYNVSQTEDKQVVTVGTPLIFTVPPYDYYKICRVQTINDTPTEVGGEFVEIGFGDLHRSNVLDKTTLGGIQGILNAHQEGTLLAIGDEVDITVNGSPWTMQLAQIDTTNHKLHFVSKYAYGSTQWTINQQYRYDISTLRTALQNFYPLIAETDKAYIKQVTRYSHDVLNSGDTWTQYTDYIWTPSYCEAIGMTMTGMPDSQSQFALFLTQANRVRTNGSAVGNWWLSDGRTLNVDRQAYYINSQGTLDAIGTGNNYYYLPCFTLIADS